jgi:hypothetical protein
MSGRHYVFAFWFSAALLVPRWCAAVDVDCQHPNVPANTVGELMVDMPMDCGPAGPIGTSRRAGA